MVKLFEKLVWALTALLIAAVVLAIVGPIVLELTANAEISLTRSDAVPPAHENWMFAFLNRGQVSVSAGRPAVQRPEFRGRDANSQRNVAGGSQGTRSVGPDGGNRQPQTDGGISPYAPVSSQPTARQPSPYSKNQTRVVQPQIIPKVWHSKVKHFKDLVDIGQSAGSSSIVIDGQQAAQLTWVAENSDLKKLGFEPGDIIVTVNGRAADRGNARALYDELKNEHVFTVEYIRGGQRLSKTFEVR